MPLDHVAILSWHNQPEQFCCINYLCDACIIFYFTKSTFAADSSVSSYLFVLLVLEVQLLILGWCQLVTIVDSWSCSLHFPFLLCIGHVIVCFSNFLNAFPTIPFYNYFLLLLFSGMFSCKLQQAYSLCLPWSNHLICSSAVYFTCNKLWAPNFCAMFNWTISLCGCNALLSSSSLLQQLLLHWALPINSSSCQSLIRYTSHIDWITYKSLQWNYCTIILTEFCKTIK